MLGWKRLHQLRNDMSFDDVHQMLHTDPRRSPEDVSQFHISLHPKLNLIKVAF